VTIGYFSVMRIAVSPGEAYPELVIDADCVLAGTVTNQRMQLVSRGNF